MGEAQQLQRRKNSGNKIGRSGIAQSALEDEGFLHSEVCPGSTNEVCKNSKLFSSYYKEE